MLRQGSSSWFLICDVAKHSFELLLLPPLPSAETTSTGHHTQQWLDFNVPQNDQKGLLKYKSLMLLPPCHPAETLHVPCWANISALPESLACLLLYWKYSITLLGFQFAQSSSKTGSHRTILMLPSREHICELLCPDSGHPAFLGNFSKPDPAAWNWYLMWHRQEMKKIRSCFLFQGRNSTSKEIMVLECNKHPQKFQWKLKEKVTRPSIMQSPSVDSSVQRCGLMRYTRGQAGAGKEQLPFLLSPSLLLFWAGS